jgi:hypothetical protein
MDETESENHQHQLTQSGNTTWQESSRFHTPSLLNQEEEMVIVRCFEMAVNDHEEADVSKFHQFQKPDPPGNRRGQMSSNSNILEDILDGEGKSMHFMETWEPKVLPLP